jgi:hypothetical protein
MNLQARIDKLKIELFDLQRAHEKAIADKQKADQEFQEFIAKNQQRFQQLNGAIAELETIQAAAEEIAKEERADAPTKPKSKLHAAA